MRTKQTPRSATAIKASRDAVKVSSASKVSPASKAIAKKASVSKKESVRAAKTTPEKFKKQNELVEVVETVNLVSPKKPSIRQSPVKKQSKSQSPDAAKKTQKAKSSAQPKKTVGPDQTTQATTDTQESSKLIKMPVMKPKKAMSAYLAFNAKRVKDDDIKSIKTIPEKSKAVGAEWKLMTDDKKAPFNEAANQDRVRFENETKQFEENGFFINAQGVKSTDIKPELKNFSADTVMPKKKTIAFCFYLKESFAQKKIDLFGENSKADVTKVAKAIRDDYAKLTESQMKKYQDLVVQDGLRYEREVEELRTNGFFVNSDGIKSTDLKKKLTKDQRKTEAAKRLVEKEKLQKEKEKTLNLRKKELEKEKKRKDQEKAQKLKEKARKEKLKAQQAQHKAKAQESQDQLEDEQSGWSCYYLDKYEVNFKAAPGKTDKAKKKVVDAQLQDKWQAFSSKVKKGWIKRAANQNGPEEELEDPPVEEQPAQKQAKKKTSLKRQKKN